MYAAGDVRIEDVPDAAIIEPTDAVMRVARACICGSDLWPYTSMERSETGQSMGHEAIGVVEDVGSQVTTIKRGDLVVMPFAYSDGTCAFCHEGLPTACVHVGFFGNNGTNGAQADALRIPFADGTLYPLPVGEDDALMPSLLTLSESWAPAITPPSSPRSRPASGPRSWATAPSAVCRHRRQAARRRADHHHGPPRGPHRARPRVRCHRRLALPVDGGYTAR
jgi:hypothetical protein